jgi:hypothetical protein
VLILRTSATNGSMSFWCLDGWCLGSETLVTALATRRGGGAWAEDMGVVGHDP